MYKKSLCIRFHGYDGICMEESSIFFGVLSHLRQTDNEKAFHSENFSLVDCYMRHNHT